MQNLTGAAINTESGGGAQRDTSDPEIIRHHVHFTPNSGSTGIINLSEIKYTGYTGNDESIDK